MYDNMTYEQLLAGMLAFALAKNPGLDSREGSPLWYGSAPSAVELQNLYIQLDTVLRETYAVTASRPYLILRAKERGLTPYEATSAIIKGEFTPASVAVPVGSRFSLGRMNYTVLGAITGETGAYTLQAETPGEIGNQSAGALVPIEYIDGLETAKATEILIPGEDQEDTEAFRQRYLDSFASQAFGGNRADYKQKVNEIEGVGGVKIYRVWNGNISPSSFLPPDGFSAWFSALPTSTPPAIKTWLETVSKAALDGLLTVGGTIRLVILDSTFGVPSETLVNTVQERVDPVTGHGEGYGLAPIGHFVTVKGVDPVTINLSVQLTYQEGWTWADVKSYAEKAIDGYLNDLAKTWADQDDPLVVRISGIETALLGCPGVIDVAGTTINTKSENLILGANEIPVRGGING